MRDEKYIPHVKSRECQLNSAYSGCRSGRSLVDRLRDTGSAYGGIGTCFSSTQLVLDQRILWENRKIYLFDIPITMQLLLQRCLAQTTASCSGAGAVKHAASYCLCPKTTTSHADSHRKLNFLSMRVLLHGTSGRRSSVLHAVEYATYGSDLSFPTEGYLVLVIFMSSS